MSKIEDALDKLSLCVAYHNNNEVSDEDLYKEIANVKAALSAIVPEGSVLTEWKPTHKHLKSGGLYMVIDDNVRLEATNTQAVLYQGQDLVRWVRSYDEFFDGRFAMIQASEGTV